MNVESQGYVYEKMKHIIVVCQEGKTRFCPQRLKSKQLATVTKVSIACFMICKAFAFFKIFLKLSFLPKNNCDVSTEKEVAFIRKIWTFKSKIIAKHFQLVLLQSKVEVVFDITFILFVDNIIFCHPYSILFIITQHELFIAESYLKCKQSVIYRWLRTS